jgi:hypothetical protein
MAGGLFYVRLSMFLLSMFLLNTSPFSRNNPPPPAAVVRKSALCLAIICGNTLHGASSPGEPPADRAPCQPPARTVPPPLRRRWPPVTGPPPGSRPPRIPAPAVPESRRADACRAPRRQSRQRPVPPGTPWESVTGIFWRNERMRQYLPNSFGGPGLAGSVMFVSGTFRVPPEAIARPAQPEDNAPPPRRRHGLLIAAV